MSNTFVIPDVLKNMPPELIKLALEAVAKAKQKANEKLVKREKKVATPEQIQAQQLKTITKMIAEANGVKTASRDYTNTKVNRQKGTASIVDELIFDKAEELHSTHIYLRKGKKSAYIYTTIALDTVNKIYKYGTQSFTSLFALHKAYCPDDTFGRSATLRSCYFSQTGENINIKNKEYCLEKWEGEFLIFTQKKPSTPIVEIIAPQVEPIVEIIAPEVVPVVEETSPVVEKKPGKPRIKKVGS